MRFRLVVLVLLMSVLAGSGCTMKFTVRPPEPSSVRYQDTSSEKRTLSVVDLRTGKAQKMSVGRISAVLVGLEEDPMGFLAQHIEREMQARGVDLTRMSESADLNLRVTTFQIRNHRATGYSPYYTFSKLAGVLEFNGQEHRVTAYFKNGKVPVWSFSEVEEPTYNVPVSLLIKEIATKISRIAFGLQASPEEVRRILSSIEADTSKLAYKRVFELGYSNNPAAIPHLREIAHDHELSLARAAAISSIGMLKATDEFEFLVEIYDSRKKIERVMALKSIGDLETPEAVAFIQKVAKSRDVRDSMIADIVELYR